MKCKGSGGTWIASRSAADIQELGCGDSRVPKADLEVAIADVQRQVVAVKSGETVPMDCTVSESQSNGREENAVRRVQGLSRTVKRRVEESLNTIIRSSGRYSVDGRVASWIDQKVRERLNRQNFVQRGPKHDAQALVAEFGETIMKMTSKDTSKKRSKMKSDESIIGTPNGVIKAKTVRRIPEDRRWCAVEVLNIRGTSPNSMSDAGENVKKMKHAPAQVREKCDSRPTVAAPQPTVRRMYIITSHIR